MESLNSPSPSTGSAGCVMRDMVRRAERFYPDKTAVVCGTRRWTYREFGTRVRKLAGAFSNLGIHKGDRVAVLMLDCHRYLELYAACSRAAVKCSGSLCAWSAGKGKRRLPAKWARS